MAIKCIVVHMAYDKRHLARLRLSVGLAKRFGAHLNVVYATPNPANPPGMIGRAASMAYLDDAREEEERHVAAIKKELAEECTGLRSWEWHEEHGGVNELVGRWAHLADLVVVEQEPREHVENGIIFHMADHLVVSAGCPLLMVPWKWQDGLPGRRVLVAWKNTREAIKAVRGGTPFLREADEVLILASANDKFTDSPGTELATYLGYHNIPARVLKPNKKAGKGILQAAEAEGCDLIVMGAFAHTRLRERLVGGVTDHVMRNTTIPVLMRQ